MGPNRILHTSKLDFQSSSFILKEQLQLSNTEKHISFMKTCS